MITMSPSLGPAVPIGFGSVLDWLMENGYMRKPESTLEKVKKGGKGASASAKGTSGPAQTNRRASARSKAYGRAFKRLAPTFKKKNGGWKKDGFKRCVKAAHRDCREKHS